MIKRYFFIPVMLMAISLVSFADGDEKIIDDIFSLIYNQQLPEAEMILQAQDNNPGKFSLHILTIDLNWWKYVLYPSEMNSRRFNALLKSLEENEKTGTPDDKIRQLIRLSYKMRFEMKRYNFLASVGLRSEIRQTLEEIKDNISGYNESEVKLFRLYTSLFSYFDNKLNPLFLESKRRARGQALHEIETLAGESNLIISTLASYFLGKIYLNHEKNPALANRYFKQLSEKFPQNSLFLKFQAETGH